MPNQEHRGPRAETRRTWDGLEMAQELPYGASIIVYRCPGGLPEFLILHRGHLGVDYEGDWAWGPPAGARLPGERIEACASRELQEETGLQLVLQPLEVTKADWQAFMARASVDAEVVLSAEHDRFEWLPAEDARERCRPLRVARQIAAAASRISAECACKEA